ncbi:MAG TPA: aldehyde dehydrogenase family protein, partial [Ramlibacter sp.]|nr:aldehyde dehydrogenase family protein [Ramlibacter sp.]
MSDPLQLTDELQLTGELVIGRGRRPGIAGAFQGVDPATGAPLAPAFAAASPEEVDLACGLAAEAFDAYRTTTGAQRADFLEAIASGIEALGDALVVRAMAETGLPRARLEGERGRTAGQLRLFAEVARSGRWQEEVLDPALPERQPQRRPELRLRMVA